ncbi:MAG TPA: Rne/Rng family ribonuclease [Candidatus Binatia bacterium]|nr:Rne/Rng family ribonuclease [Candidatus Binatia bacterium]
MKQDIIINATAHESRIAIMEDDSLAEFLIERGKERGIVGNIYKGKVSRVLPGMQAAFVDIGLDKAAFLHVSDFSSGPEDVSRLLTESEEEIIFETPKPSFHRLPIERQLSRGQDVLVQAAKDPLGMKGARLTSHISLPGRHVVFMPTTRHMGISRRIDDEKERKRLKEIAQSLMTDQGGFIMRTACEGRSKREIQRDLAFLTKLWRRIKGKSESAAAPALIHQDLDLIARTVRDFFTTETHQVFIDNAKEYRRMLDFVGQFMPRLKPKIKLYAQPEPIMNHFGVEQKIAKALEPKAWLPSGGYIIIGRTEALTAIDVNTGRFVGRRNQEDTILKTNLEAVQEIVSQLRLRNIGGIIVIDFIDMERESNRKKVYETLKEAIKKDKARTKILKISEFGLVEMTRQRTRESLENMLLSACPYCEGRGRIKSNVTIAYEILRAIKQEKTHLEDGKRIIVRIHPDIANLLYDQESQSLDEMEREINHKIIIKASDSLPHEKYEISTL